jgi:hypothetical protein
LNLPTGNLSRISKLFVDRDQVSVEAALAYRRRHVVHLVCGADVGPSRTLQLAVLTAANLASRCFPGAVQVVMDSKSKEAPFLVWPTLELNLQQVLIGILGPNAFAASIGVEVADHTVIFGDAPARKGALRVTYDGWIAKVGPSLDIPRLPERNLCSLAAVLAASLSISELFQSFANISVEATRRAVAFSLWRPDLDVSDAEALGIQVEFLPRELWVLGLGHLGNAYLWSLATLPYQNPASVELSLLDFERIERDNLETGVLLSAHDIDRYKARACGAWLEARGFRSRLVERRFDATFRCATEEPQLALCGFDSNAARRDLYSAQFARVIECGLGGTINNFDTISLHTLPNPRRAYELWPDLTDADKSRLKVHDERVAAENAGYAPLAPDECGRYQLVGKAVAVPFVGAVAASFVVAETIRLLHDGPAYAGLKLRLAVPGDRPVPSQTYYRAQDTAPVRYCDANVTFE